MKSEMREYEITLAERNPDCRVFIEFAAAHREQYQGWLDNEIAELIKKED